MSPYIGWAADAVLEFDLIDYNGNELVANENENPDLYWALGGGGSGMGVITKIKTAVVASPEPGEGTRKFTAMYFKYDTSGYCPPFKTSCTMLSRIRIAMEEVQVSTTSLQPYKASTWELLRRQSTCSRAQA